MGFLVHFLSCTKGVKKPEDAILSVILFIPLLLYFSYT